MRSSSHRPLTTTRLAASSLPRLVASAGLCLFALGPLDVGASLMPVAEAGERAPGQAPQLTYPADGAEGVPVDALLWMQGGSVGDLGLVDGLFVLFPLDAEGNADEAGEVRTVRWFDEGSVSSQTYYGYGTPISHAVPEADLAPDTTYGLFYLGGSYVEGAAPPDPNGPPGSKIATFTTGSAKLEKPEPPAFAGLHVGKVDGKEPDDLASKVEASAVISLEFPGDDLYVVKATLGGDHKWRVFAPAAKGKDSISISLAKKPSGDKVCAKVQAFSIKRESLAEETVCNK